MLAVVLALCLTATSALTHQQIVEKVNAAGTTWTAAINPRFVEAGSGRALYGVKEAENKAERERLIANGEITLADNVTPEQAASIPDDFDSETNWPECAKVIGDIRDQSNCGCCWAFGAASAASDRACIASGADIFVPLSAQDVCFNAESNGCNGGTLFTPWLFVKTTGVVTGGQYLNDTAPTPSDPFDGEGFCASFSLPHCHHHGDATNDPYPAEGTDGCPTVYRSPTGPTACDDSSVIEDFESDKYSFSGSVHAYSSDVSTIQYAIMTDGPVEASFSVYSDFETYSSGIYQHTVGSYEGGHAIRIVGWGSEDGTDYWKVANSWNPYWGEEGYFRILRGSDECGIESNVVASSAGATWAKKSALA